MMPINEYTEGTGKKTRIVREVSMPFGDEELKLSEECWTIDPFLPARVWAEKTCDDARLSIDPKWIKSNRVKAEKGSREWYAMEIIVRYEYLQNLIAKNDARNAAYSGCMLCAVIMDIERKFELDPMIKRGENANTAVHLGAQIANSRYREAEKFCVSTADELRGKSPEIAKNEMLSLLMVKLKEKDCTVPSTVKIWEYLVMADSEQRICIPEHVREPGRRSNKQINK